MCIFANCKTAALEWRMNVHRCASVGPHSTRGLLITQQAVIQGPTYTHEHKQCRPVVYQDRPHIHTHEHKQYRPASCLGLPPHIHAILARQIFRVFTLLNIHASNARAYTHVCMEFNPPVIQGPCLPLQKSFNAMQGSCVGSLHSSHKQLGIVRTKKVRMRVCLCSLSWVFTYPLRSGQTEEKQEREITKVFCEVDSQLFGRILLERLVIFLLDFLGGCYFLSLSV